MSKFLTDLDPELLKMLSPERNTTITDSHKIVKLMEACFFTEAVIEITAEGSKGASFALFVSEGDALNPHTVLRVKMVRTNVNDLKMISQKEILSYNFSLSGALLSGRSRRKNLTVVNKKVYVDLSWPQEIQIAKMNFEKRLQMLPDMTIKAVVRKNKKALFSTQVFDISKSGVSFVNPLLRVHKAKWPIRGKNDLISLLVIAGWAGAMAPDEIPMTCVIRGTRTVRREYDNALFDVFGAEIMLVAQSFHEVFARFLADARSEIDKYMDNLLLADDGALGDDDDNEEYQEIYQAIAAGKVGLMQKYLEEYSNRTPLCAALVGGVVQHGFSADYYQALEQVVSAQDAHDEVNILLKEILKKKHFVTLKRTLLLIHATSQSDQKEFKYLSNYLSELTKLLSSFPESKILTLVETMEKEDALQSVFIKKLMATGCSVEVCMRCMEYLHYPSESAVPLVKYIARKSDSAVMIAKAITLMRERTQERDNEAMREANRILVRRFVGVASQLQLIHMLREEISDHDEAGERIVAELVERGDPGFMAKAFELMTLDSDASMMLALGLSEKGTRKYALQAYEATEGHCERARIILKFYGNSMGPIRKIAKEKDRESQSVELLEQARGILNKTLQQDQHAV